MTCGICSVQKDDRKATHSTPGQCVGAIDAEIVRHETRIKYLRARRRAIRRLKNGDRIAHVERRCL